MEAALQRRVEEACCRGAGFVHVAGTYRVVLKFSMVCPAKPGGVERCRSSASRRMPKRMTRFG